MKLTVLVDTDGLPSVPCSFALAFAFLAASRFFLESDTICAVWAQLLWIVRTKHAQYCELLARKREAARLCTQQEARSIMPNINPANGSSSPGFSIRSKSLKRWRRLSIMHGSGAKSFSTFTAPFCVPLEISRILSVGA